MQNVIQTLYGVNMYINAVNYAGRIQETTLPQVKSKNIEHKPASNLGAFSLPGGFEEMNLKTKHNSVDADIMAVSADIYTYQDIMIRGNIDAYTRGGRTGSAAFVAVLKARSLGTPAVTQKHQDNPDIDVEWGVIAYRLEIAGEEIFDIDFFAQKYIVEGVDLMGDFRVNLGL
jgi:P2 family phage contractile tail tube protein